MGKRKPAYDPARQQSLFDVPETDVCDGMLADLPRVVASLVSAMLKRDPRSRFDVAADVSRLLGDDVSKWQLDAWCSEAKEQHRIPFDRMLALAAATGTHELLGHALRRIGCDVLVGEEVFLAEIGHLESQKRAIDARLRDLKAEARPLNRGDRRK